MKKPADDLGEGRRGAQSLTVVFGHLNCKTTPQPEQFCLLHATVLNATNEEANKNSGKKKRKIIKT